MFCGAGVWYEDTKIKMPGAGQVADGFGSFVCVCLCPACPSMPKDQQTLRHTRLPGGRESPGEGSPGGAEKKGLAVRF